MGKNILRVGNYLLALFGILVYIILKSKKYAIKFYVFNFVIASGLPIRADKLDKISDMLYKSGGFVLEFIVNEQDGSGNAQDECINEQDDCGNEQHECGNEQHERQC